MKKITAFCYASGLIEFDHAAKPPPGTILIVRGPEKRVRKTVKALARWSYPTKRGGNDEKPIVPGVPEASSPLKAIDAVVRFVNQVRNRIENTETRTP